MSVLVSAIIPVYNSEEFLEECIVSLINQTLENIEIIVVNDGSSDKSLDILKKYEKIDSRLIIIDQKIMDLAQLGIEELKLLVENIYHSLILMIG